MSEVNFGKVFGTLLYLRAMSRVSDTIKQEENRCQISELSSSWKCDNPAGRTIQINGYLNEAHDWLDTETIAVCEDCKAALPTSVWIE